MTRAEFEQLRDLPGKIVRGNIVFASGRNGHRNLTFEKVALENSLNWRVFINGTYKPDIPTTIFNFVLHEVGPICRICVNGAMHKGLRYHKHDLQTDGCPDKDLPCIIERPDLVGKTAKEVWEILCRQAKIEHQGLFDPMGQAT